MPNLRYLWNHVPLITSSFHHIVIGDFHDTIQPHENSSVLVLGLILRALFPAEEHVGSHRDIFLLSPKIVVILVLVRRFFDSNSLNQLRA